MVSKRGCRYLMSVTGVVVWGALVATAGASAPARVARACNDSVPTPVPQPTAAQMKAAGLGNLPVAPSDRRVDLVAAPFSDPTNVTNPLFPTGRLSSVVLNGRVDGKAFRTETTLLPETRIIEWSPGQCVKTLVSQYVAYLDGRLQEVALDFYAQADDGSVWYFGEDVYNYVSGVVADTSGTWLAGKEGPAAMIMPASPQVGDVNRPENIPGLVWEEVAIKTVGQTVEGPRGPVTGAMVGRELHDDGTFSDKTFAPGYGEFLTAHEGDVEALALAIPTDSVPGPPPAELVRLSRGAKRVFRMVAGDRLGLDLQLRYRPPASIDRARFGLWTRQVGVDAAAGRAGAVSGDAATLEWLRDRFAGGLDGVAITRIDTLLERLRGNVADGELAAAAGTAAKLRIALRRAPMAG